MRQLRVALPSHLVGSCRRAMSTSPLRNALAANHLPAQPATSALSLLQTKRSQSEARVGSPLTSRGLSTGTEREAYYPSRPADREQPKGPRTGSASENESKRKTETASGKAMAWAMIGKRLVGSVNFLIGC